MSRKKFKLVNADYGLDSVMADPAKRKWYCWHRFPLVPMVDRREADEWNTSDFSFSWLNVRIWSMMSPDLGAEFMIEDVGIYARLRLPYLNIIVWCLPFPQSWHQRLWRKPASDS